MPLRDWRCRRETHQSRHDLLIAVAQLRVFTTVLRTEIDRTNQGADGDDPPPEPTDQPRR
jgi:hypothetical protein